jgi:hypothetical protein
MAFTTGTVSCLNLSDVFGVFSIRIAPGNEEAFFLWLGDTRSVGPIALWIPQLQLALSRGLTVTITHGDTSAFIDAVRINSA